MRSRTRSPHSQSDYIQLSGRGEERGDATSTGKEEMTDGRKVISKPSRWHFTQELNDAADVFRGDCSLCSHAGETQTSFLSSCLASVRKTFIPWHNLNWCVAVSRWITATYSVLICDGLAVSLNVLICVGLQINCNSQGRIEWDRSHLCSLVVVSRKGKTIFCVRWHRFGGIVSLSNVCTVT